MNADPARELKRRVELEKMFGLDSIPFEPIARVPAPESEATQDPLELIAAEVAACTLCPLCETRTNTVPGVGNPRSTVLFVGEAPGRDEDLKGEPFVGRAGKLLDKIIETTLDRTRQDIYIANIIKCRPPQNRNPNPQEMGKCMPYLQRQIESIGPKVICALGSVAAKALLETDQTIGRLRGLFHPMPGFESIEVLPTYHPAYLLRNPGDKRKVWEDMKKLKTRLDELEA